MKQADVVIPVFGDVEVTRACIESVLTLSGAALRTLTLVDDCGPDVAMRPMLRRFRDEVDCVRLIENEQNLGFVGSANRGLALRHGDCVILNSDTRVTEGWLAELLEVSVLHPRIAAVCPLSNNAGAYSVPITAPSKALLGLPRWSEMPTGVGFCMLMRDAVLHLAGGFDPAFGAGYNEENDWCQRVMNLGFIIARANGAFVFHHGEVSFAGARNERDVLNARKLHGRYPYYLEMNRHFASGPMARLASSATRDRLRVCIDVSHLTAPNIHGTANYATSLVESLHQLEQVEVAARVSNALLATYFRERGIATVPLESADEFDVTHFPSQIYETGEAGRLLACSGHLVLTWQDLIAYRAPLALKTWPRVETLRALTWAALQSAQAIIAISKSARDDLVSAFGLAESRIDVVPLGTTTPSVVDALEVQGRHGLTARGYFLVLGSDYPHKNLRFALDAWRLLKHQLGEATPQLVFAGPRSGVHDGFFDRLPADGGVRGLGELPANEVGAVLSGAAALVFPSAFEGFGLPMLEAMSLDVPVVALRISAIPEVAADAALLASPWSVEAFAEQLAAVLDEAVRARLIARGRSRAAELTWQKTAVATLEVYRRVVNSPIAATLQARDAMRTLLR